MKILHIILWVLMLVGIGVVLGFVNKSQSTQLLDPANVRIDIDYETENRFVDEEDVKMHIINSKDTSFKAISHFNVLEIEQKINNNPSIKDAQVYRTIDGKIKVTVKQRQPIARIFSKEGSYYIDEQGNLMPLSSKYTARLVVVNGHVFEPFAARYQLNYQNLPDSLQPKTRLDEIFKLTHFIHQSPFWKAQIEQVYVNKDSEFELIPKVGNHIIVLGGIDFLEEKFNKLMVFYQKGLPKTGWNEYSEINLKYKNQIVCTKIYN